jgi:hypothetical protein
MEGMLLDAFQEKELGDDIDVIDVFYESLKFSSTTPRFGPIHGYERSTQPGTKILLYNLKAMYGMLDTRFSTLLR